MNRWSCWLPNCPGSKESAVGIAASMALAALFVISHDSDPDGRTSVASLLPSGLNSSTTDALASTSAGISDDELRQKVLGRWHSRFYGDRVVENRPDGKASMQIDFNWVAALKYGWKMSLELDWTIENGVMTYRITSGIPKSQYEAMIRDQGSKASYHFERISESEMRLVRTTDKTEKYTWTRVK